MSGGGKPRKEEDMIVVETDRVLRAIERETDALLEHLLQVFLEIDFQEHSALNGLTGGHVVTYLAREADRMADELLAASGRPVPPPEPGRQWDVETGSLRPGAVLIDDLHVSADRLRAALAAVEDWSTLDEPGRAIPGRRLLQLVVHHADLGRPWGEVPEEDAELAAALFPGADGGSASGGSATARLARATGRDGVGSVGAAPVGGATGGAAGTPCPPHPIWI